jgi:hypothetical protein
MTFIGDFTFMAAEVENLSEGHLALRAQPILDFDFNNLLGKDLLLSTYGVMNVNRLSQTTSAGREIVPYFEEAGLEVTLSDMLPFAKKLKADYAVLLNYNDWNATDGLKMNSLYNSIMLNADISDSVNVHAGSVIRVYSEKEATQIPLGLAFGAKFNGIKLPGHPSFWTHFCYGMNPYEDNNYSLYRADDPQNKAAHRTYLLNGLDTNMTKSQISLGLIWNL